MNGRILLTCHYLHMNIDYYYYYYKLLDLSLYFLYYYLNLLVDLSANLLIVYEAIAVGLVYRKRMDVLIEYFDYR
jgi:hypothetical protein